MSTRFQQDLIQRYQYVSSDGRYRITQWVDEARIIHQEKVGYATETDAIAEADALARLVADHKLSGTLYACVDISDLDGMDRAAREVYVNRFQDGDFKWVVALFGANALLRFIGRIFQRRDLSLQFRHCKTRRDAMLFLHGQILRRDDVRAALSPETFGFGTGTMSRSGSEHANRFAYRSPTGDFFAVYHHIAPDVVFISLNGTLEKHEELTAAQRVAQQMYEQINERNFYVILDSSGVKRISLSARRAYLDYLKKARPRERLVIHIGSQLSRFLLRSLKRLSNSALVHWRPARDVAEALKIIELERDLSPLNSSTIPVVEHAAYGPAEDLNTPSVKPMIDWLIHLGWDVNYEPQPLVLKSDHPYHELAMSIQLLQTDLRESFALQNEQLEALKENREQLEHAQALAKLATLDWQPDSGELNWSPETFRLFGYDETTVAPTFHEFKNLLHADCREMVLRILDNAVDSKDPFDCQVTIIRQNGEERICRLRGRSMVHARLRRTLVRVTFLDITDVIAAKLEAEQARSVLEEGHAELKAYLAALSHDVRTPLTSLKLGLSRITDDQLPKNLGPTLRAEVEHLDGLFANMLSLARLKVIGPEDSALMSCDLSVLLDRVRTRLLLLAQDREIDIHLKSTDTDTTLLADELAIEQALTNVVHNAIKFARSQTTLWIETTPSTLTICIQDDGPGLEADHAVRTLEANAEVSKFENIAGLGLGVAIAKRIIQNHRGTLSVVHSDQLGTLVTIKLPKRSQSL